MANRRIAEDYRRKLTDPRWQRKRLEVLEAAHFGCEDCGDEDSTLHVHHSFYEKDREPWDYESTGLTCLCGPCHERAEKERRALIAALAECPSSEIAKITGYVVAVTGVAIAGFSGRVASYEEAEGVADALGCSPELVLGLNEQERPERVAKATDSILKRKRTMLRQERKELEKLMHTMAATDGDHATG